MPHSCGGCDLLEFDPLLVGPPSCWWLLIGSQSCVGAGSGETE